jgi:predicted Zn-dependent protease
MKNLHLLIIIVLFSVSCKKTVDTIATKQTPMPEVCVVKLDPNQIGKLDPNLIGTPNMKKPVHLITTTSTSDPSFGVMLLDFDGQRISSNYWNNGQTFTCAPSGFDATQIALILNEVRTDYARYKINITIDEQVYLQANAAKRMRVVLTPTSGWYTGVSGVTYTGSLTWGNDTPCFVFIDRLSYNTHLVSEICAHELGHAVGLRHQSTYSATCGFISAYNSGDGTNAPLMGNSLYATNGGSWWVGPTPMGCTTVQDDDKILTANLLLR